MKNENELDYKDPFLTTEQKGRDKLVTELLSEYVGSHKKKVHHSTVCRYLILTPCILIVCAFAVMLIAFSVEVMNYAY